MVRNTGSYNTCDSSHERKLTLSASGVNVELSKVSPELLGTPTELLELLEGERHRMEFNL